MKKADIMAALRHKQSKVTTGGLDLSGLNRKAPAGAKNDSYYVPPNVVDAELAEATLKAIADQAAAFGREKELKSEIIRAAKPWFFEEFQGKRDAPSSVVVRGKGGMELTIAFKNDYRKATDIDALTPIIGAELTDAYFKQKVGVTIDMDKVPVKKQQEVVDALVQLGIDHGVADAIEVAAKWKPTTEWHSARMELPTELNTAIEQEGNTFTIAISKRRAK